MDSPSSGLPQPTIDSRPQYEAGFVSETVELVERAPSAGILLVASCGSAVAVDYAAFVNQRSPGLVTVIGDDPISALVEEPVRTRSLKGFAASTAYERGEEGGVPSLMVFLPSRLTKRAQNELDDLLEIARKWPRGFVGVISSFRVHLDDPDAVEVENYVVTRLTSMSVRAVVFRPGNVLSRHSLVSRALARFSPFYPLVPARLCSCFIDAAEFLGAVEAIRLEEIRSITPADSSHMGESVTSAESPGRRVGGRSRVYTLLGANRSWREVMRRDRAPRVGQSLVTAGITLLSWLMLGQAVAVALLLLSRRFPRLKQCNVKTIEPSSIRDLLALCHRRNIGHVRVVGYNNGVNHFGHRHPGKTIVSTVRCRRMVETGRQTLKADCGTTIRSALDFLAAKQRELYVVPNYSYVSLGTAFFVPIHGSAIDFSTVADTINRVVFFDPDRDRIVAACREDAAFREHVYDQQSRVVVLRVYLLTKPKSSYFVRRETLENASSADLLDALGDPGATNVEIRQTQAKSAKVTVARYYKEAGGTSSPALELPRDTLGRLWDQLEENPVSSFLMHALSRHVAWHTELFFTLPEFDTFWRTHGKVPLRKIQLRYLRRDGLPKSPFRDHDRVSADLFIFRWDKAPFLDYLRNTFTAVLTNPGKHSH